MMPSRAKRGYCTLTTKYGKRKRYRKGEDVMASQSRNQLIMEAATSYLSTLNPGSLPCAADMESELLEYANDQIELANASILSKDRKYKMLSSLPARTIAQIILRFYPVANLKLEGGTKALAVYCGSGKNKGLYDMDEDAIKRIIEQYGADMSEKEISDVFAKLERNAPFLGLTKNKDLIPVNNGVFDYEKKLLLDFSPDMVFTSKCGVDYNPSAQNITIHNPEDGTDWDVESWMLSLSDDLEIVNLLWEITGACIRPNVVWGKSAWLFDANGNNGKGTLCRMMQNLCGEDSCDSISVEDFGTDAFLENLMRKTAIICDENNVGTYLDKAKNFKKAVTGDPITINRKYRSTVKFRFCGFIVQCMNALPKVKDRSESFNRRLIIIPMTKCFTGIERKYIKEDYLGRREVLEYVLHKMLHMNYHSLSEPKICRDLVAEFKVYNDPLAEFWNDFRGQFVWDLLPFAFLYDLFREWSRRFCPSGKIIGHNSFCRELRKLAANDMEWEAPETPSTTGRKLDRPEPLIDEYNVKGWQNPNVCAVYTLQRQHTKSSYRGLVRKLPPVCPSNADGCEEH